MSGQLINIACTAGEYGNIVLRILPLLADLEMKYTLRLSQDFANIMAKWIDDNCGISTEKMSSVKSNFYLSRVEGVSLHTK